MAGSRHCDYNAVMSAAALVPPTAHRPILIVDDDESIRTSLADVLGDEGYVVATAADGLEALEYLRHSTLVPCLILLDLWMPRLNGQGFREQQLANRDWLSIPVVVISAA